MASRVDELVATVCPLGDLGPPPRVLAHPQREVVDAALVRVDVLKRRGAHGDNGASRHVGAAHEDVTVHSLLLPQRVDLSQHSRGETECTALSSVKPRLTQVVLRIVYSRCTRVYVHLSRQVGILKGGTDPNLGGLAPSCDERQVRRVQGAGCAVRGAAVQHLPPREPAGLQDATTGRGRGGRQSKQDLYTCRL